MSAPSIGVPDQKLRPELPIEEKALPELPHGNRYGELPTKEPWMQFELSLESSISNDLKTLGAKSPDGSWWARSMSPVEMEAPSRDQRLG